MSQKLICPHNNIEAPPLIELMNSSLSILIAYPINFLSFYACESLSQCETKLKNFHTLMPLIIFKLFHFHSLS
ncbi:hypothetical protein RIF29_41538 [Crotalaria pallida]|uniref:Uncharacterized protein n=1 Tax=Crotalaria pallida TaxID=3830 RepID=A0AAN9E885_CROPI